MCSLDGKKCRLPWTAKPSMDILSVQIIMDRHGVSQVPVVSEHIEDHREHPVGLLDRECINVTCRFLQTFCLRLNFLYLVSVLSCTSYIQY